MLDNSGKITKNYKLMGTESDPVVIAQRLLNLYRQLHIFSAEKKEAYNKMLIEQPIEVKRIIGTLPGGVVVQQYLADIEKEAGLSSEHFEQSPSANAETQAYSSDSTQDQPRVVVQSAASPEMAHEIAKAFKEALVTSDKNRKEDTKELAQTLMALQSKLTQTILEKQSKNTTESQSELIKTITHTQTQEFSAIISQALKEIRQMSNDALIEAIQKVHSENIDFFKNQIFSSVSPMPMSAHYDAKMQEYNEKYNAEDDETLSLDEYIESSSPVKETAVEDISEDEYYKEMAQHEEEAPEETEKEEEPEEIDESLLEGFDGNPEDLFENDTEWKNSEDENVEEQPENTEEAPKEDNSGASQEGHASEENISETEEKVSDEQQNKEETSESQEYNEEKISASQESTEEEYEWEYVDEDEDNQESQNNSQNASVPESTPSAPTSTEVQAAYNILESVDNNDSEEEYEWEYVDEDENSQDAEEYEWEYVEDESGEDSEEYNFDEDPYNPDLPPQINKKNNILLKEDETQQNSAQTNDNIILDDNFGISSNDDN